MSMLMSEPDGATPIEPEEMDGLRHKHVTTRGPKECMPSIIRSIKALDAKPLF